MTNKIGWAGNIEELLEEPDDLRRDIVLVLQRMKSERALSSKIKMPAEAYRNVRLALGETSADMLLEKDDARQVRPAELVLRGLCLAIRPLKRLHSQPKKATYQCLCWMLGRVP